MKTGKRFLALARVSSREQEREGFSLAVQEDALRRFAEKAGGSIVKLYSVAETASKDSQRKTFKELLAYAQKHAFELDGVLFYKLDRAARNLFDYVELERLESQYGLPFFATSQPTENTPAGKMMRRTLANMAAFYTDQQALDVKDGHARRAKDGWFVCRAPYGYKNRRVDGRSVVVLDEHAEKVKKIFHLFAHKPLTLDGLIAYLEAQGIYYRDDRPRFARTSIHSILTDRSYRGEVKYRGQWYPGRHEPLVNKETWDRAQAILGGHLYRAHEMTYAGELLRCQHCGHPITGERKTKGEGRVYTYYRCSRYTRPGHPRIRVREADLDAQVLAIFRSLKIGDKQEREWWREAIKGFAGQSNADTAAQRAELVRLQTLYIKQKERLLALRLDDEIEPADYARKNTELRDRLEDVKLQMDALDRGQDANDELALKVFELSQSLENKWFTSSSSAKREILNLVCLNYKLEGVSLVSEMNKAFDLLAKGLISPEYRGSGTPIELFVRACEDLRHGMGRLEMAG